LIFEGDCASYEKRHQINKTLDAMLKKWRILASLIAVVVVQGWAGDVWSEFDAHRSKRVAE
jgi:hypothetical protein